MDINEFKHSLQTWEVYPRVFYFKRRFTDLYSRFKKLTNAITNRFHYVGLMNNVEKLNNSLKKCPRVTVIGAEDMTPQDFVVSATPLNQNTELPPPVTTGIDIYICHAKVSNLDESGLKVIDTVVQYFSKTDYQVRSDLCYIFIVCQTTEQYSEDDSIKFRASIVKELENQPGFSQHPFHVLVGPIENQLQNTISDALEKDIVKHFQDMFAYFHKFMRKDIRSDPEKIIVLESETVVNEIRGFLGNGPALADVKCHMKQDSFTELVLESLCRKVQCAAVSPLAAKYCLPESVCYDLLEELHFDKDLINSVTRNTRYHIQKLEKFAENFEEKAQQIGKQYVYDQKKCHDFDFILYQLQNDMKETVESAEKKFSSMERITTVMRKMSFEIRGYLRQSDISTADAKGEAGTYDLPSKYITNELREEILGMKGVQGVGTLYGQLEIHLEKDLSPEKVHDIKKDLGDLLCKRQFHHHYLVRTIEENAKKLTKGQYKQGDRLASPFPDNMEVYREGTLGCYAKNEKGLLFCLTCAHVVDPHNKKEHDVFVDNGNGRKRFGISTQQMILYSGEGNIPLIDFAAVMIVNDANVISSCNPCMRDELGKPKPVRVANHTPHEFVGCDVYKYGAKTGLTKGIISSVDYSCSENARDHLIIIEPPPAVDHNDTQADRRTDSPSLSPEHTTFDNLEIQGLDSGIGSSLSLSSDENDSSTECPVERDNHLTQQNDSFEDTAKKITEEENPSYNVRMPKPETLDAAHPRNCETMPSDILNRYFSTTSNPAFASKVFADEGDSGSIVFMNDLRSNYVEVLSMIIAGNLKLKGSESQSSDTVKCFSFSLNKALAKLEQKCKTRLDLNLPLGTSAL